MDTIIKIPRITFAESVKDEIERTVGALPAETGGVLGGNIETGEVTHYYFDEHADCSAVIYNVDAARINPVISAWNAEGISLVGIIHSHPKGLEMPSAPDIAFARRLLNRPDNAALPRFLIPIVQSSTNGEFSMRVFAVDRKAENKILEMSYDVVPAADLQPFPVTSREYRETFSRVRHAHDLKRLHYSMVIGVGCGAAISFYEDLARAGIRFFVLIDPDVVDPSNIATQQCYRKDIGQPKVTVIKNRILDINSLAVITAIQKPIEALSDADLRTLIFETGTAGEEIETRLLCGLTDSFWAQMRINLLALKFMVPALGAAVYRSGAAAEIVFTHPDTTHQCMRCILSQRYQAYIEKGFKNDAKSEGAQYYATVRLNATKYFVAMAALHHGTAHPFWGPMLGRIEQRNCIQIRCDPDVESTLGLKNFEKAFSGASGDRLFCDESIWLPQHPENRASGYDYDCPDCGGGGNLIDSQGRFEDTRLVVAETQMRAERRLLQ